MGQTQSTASAYNFGSARAAAAAADAAAVSQDMSADAQGHRGAAKRRDKSAARAPISQKQGAKQAAHDDRRALAQEQHVRKLSIVSNRNIQLLSMKPRNERDNYAEGLRARRRSSLINLILGAPSSGPRFSDDLCSLSSHMSDFCRNFSIDYFPDAASHNQASRAKTGSTNSSLVRLEEGRTCHLGVCASTQATQADDAFVSGHRRRRSSLGSLASSLESGQVWRDPYHTDNGQPHNAAPVSGAQSKPTSDRQLGHRYPSLSSIFMASIDLTNNSPDDKQAIDCEQEQSDVSGPPIPMHSDEQTMSGNSALDRVRANTGAQDRIGERSEDKAQMSAVGPYCINQAAPSAANIAGKGKRMLHRSGSELSLYSSRSASTATACPSHQQHHHHHHHHHPNDLHHPLNQHKCASTFHGKHTVSRLSSNSSSASAAPGGCCAGLVSARVGSFEPMPHAAREGKCDEDNQPNVLLRETKLIIMLQVCLPFILAGFGNMAAGLVLNKLAHWQSFQHVPIFFVLLPSFVGMKGNIEMTLASRLSTLANLNLLGTGNQRRHAYLSNLILILSQAIGLSLFAALASMLCEYSMGKLEFSFTQTVHITFLVVLPCALITSIVLVFVSSIVMWWSVCLANWIQVNPDNLSTLLAAMYGDVSCVLTYGLFAELMYSFYQQNVLLWPILIICISLASWPIFWYVAYKYEETRALSLSSMPPMLTGIVVSLGSGTVLSLVVGRFTRIALYQPVVNGFGANLIAVQASRVSTWLWCSALRRLSAASSQSTLETADDCNQTDKLTSATSRLFNMTGLPTRKQMIVGDKKTSVEDGGKSEEKSAIHRRVYSLVAVGVSRGLGLLWRIIKIMLWSFLNPSPNSVAARLLLIMLLPAHTLYFFVIWMLSPTNYVLLTWPFYAVYMALCLTQVFVLLLICEPLMTLLMRRHLDPDIFGISLLMALADLVGTLCLTGAFWLLASLGDPNAF